MSKMTIIELCMSPDLGGLELYMALVAKNLSNEFNVIPVIKRGSKLESYYENNLDVVKLNKSSKLFMFNAARELANLIDSKNVDIVHMHWGKDTPFVVLAKLLSKRRPKIVQSRHMTMTRFKNSFYHRTLYKQIDLILPVTQQLKEQLEKFIPSNIRPRIEHLYLGVEKEALLGSIELDRYKKELGFNKTDFKIGMVGRINEAKGQHLLIKALQNIKNRDVHIYFVGQEMRRGYIDELKSLSRALKVEDRVHFLGFLENPHHFYQACDVVVLASKRETFGLVLIEAMSVGTAVIGSNSGGVLEIIDDKESGLLFETGNFHSLGESIEHLIENRSLLIKIAQNGQIKCNEKFSNEKQILELINILKSLKDL